MDILLENVYINTTTLIVMNPISVLLIFFLNQELCALILMSLFVDSLLIVSLRILCKTK